MTSGEKILWDRLKNKQLGVWFYAQQLVYGFVADFWCPSAGSAGLVVEVDGPYHARRKKYDQKRDRVLAAKGILTMRFKVGEVQRNLNAVVSLIRNKVQKK